MKSNVLLPGGQTADANETLKVTALQYFKEALIGEKFEQCGELAKAAKRYGAKPYEIEAIIAEYVRGPSKAGPNEANQDSVIRKRF